MVTDTECPRLRDDDGNITAEYKGTIRIRNQEALANTGIWSTRQYFKISIAEGLETVDSSIGGTIGYTGTYKGETYDGTSVSWNIYEDEVNPGNGTLVIYPSDRKWGLMRDWDSQIHVLADNTQEQPFPEWTPIGGTDKQEFLMYNKVIILPGVEAHGSLENMFYGCEFVTSFDMRGLITTEGTTSMHQMFAEDKALTKVSVSATPFG